jgi:hypothetical protein
MAAVFSRRQAKEGRQADPFARSKNQIRLLRKPERLSDLSGLRHAHSEIFDQPVL